MKIKLPFAVLCVFALSFAVFSQTLSITSKKTVYTRKGKEIPRERKTFTVVYPIVSGALSPTVKKKLENTISYWRIFETTLAENLGDYFWLTDLNYKINYNKNGILDIALTQEGVGAYPDEQTVDLIINSKTGERVKFENAFDKNSSAKLAKMVKAKLELEKKSIIKRIDKGEFYDGAPDKERNNSLKEQLAELQFTAESFDEFSVSDKGVTFLYDAGFPHVIQALQPDGRYFFSWAELKPFIKRGGLLERFVR